MTKYRGLTHFESYNNATASAESEDLSAESFMEQKLEDGDSEIDEEKNLDAIRETSRALEMAQAAEFQQEQGTEKNIAEEEEDIKPDISFSSSQNNATSITSSPSGSEILPQPQEHNNSFQPNQHFAAISGTTQNTSHLYNNESHSSNNCSPSESSSEREYQVGSLSNFSSLFEL